MDKETHREEGCVRTPADCRSSQKPRNTGATRSWKSQILPSRLWREHSSTDTLISAFWPPKLQENEFCCFQPPNSWSCVTAATRTHTVGQNQDPRRGQEWETGMRVPQSHRAPRGRRGVLRLEMRGHCSCCNGPGHPSMYGGP